MDEKVVNDNAQVERHKQPRSGPTPVVWLMLALASLLALAVIFVLPGVVAEYELPFTPRAQLTDPAPQLLRPSAAISPFEEAQRAKQRQEAQQVLASLLERQNALEAAEVMKWAAADYEAALEYARLGDESYRTQAFAQATEQYRRADSDLAAIQDASSRVLADSLAMAQEALRAGDAASASEHFRLALVLAPSNAVAQAGLARAATLEDVLALLAQAEGLRATGQLQVALERVQQALALDGAHQATRELGASLRTEIADNTFTRIMSAGFAALQAETPDEASAQFERALALRPNSTQAREALTQAQDKRAVQQITAHRQAAQDFEEREQWAQAVSEYEAALAIDANIVFAVQGLDYAQKRLQLDRLLQDAIEQPERLADTGVYEQAVQVYYTGRNIDPTGARLQAQLQSLEGLLSKAQVPVEVQLLSDQKTEVTVYQVGVLGQFEQRVLSLKPGKYVAVGTRVGYRDVRKEFEVGFDNRSAPVVVACTEKIVAVNRR